MKRFIPFFSLSFLLVLSFGLFAHNGMVIDTTGPAAIAEGLTADPEAVNAIPKGMSKEEAFMRGIILQPDTPAVVVETVEVGVFGLTGMGEIGLLDRKDFMGTTGVVFTGGGELYLTYQLTKSVEAYGGLIASTMQDQYRDILRSVLAPNLGISLEMPGQEDNFVRVRGFGEFVFDYTLSTNRKEVTDRDYSYEAQPDSERFKIFLGAEITLGKAFTLYGQANLNAGTDYAWTQFHNPSFGEREVRIKHYLAGMRADLGRVAIDVSTIDGKAVVPRIEVEAAKNMGLFGTASIMQSPNAALEKSGTDDGFKLSWLGFGAYYKLQ